MFEHVSERFKLWLAQGSTAGTASKGEEVAQSTPPAGTTIQTGWYTPDPNDRFFLTSGQDITPEQILAYVRLAEVGETRYLHAFYEEMCSRDTHIQAELNKQYALVTGARRDIMPMPASLRKSAAKARIIARKVAKKKAAAAANPFGPATDAMATVSKSATGAPSASVTAFGKSAAAPPEAGSGTQDAVEDPLSPEEQQQQADYQLAQDVANYVEGQLNAPSIRFARSIAHLIKARYTSISVLEVVVMPGAGPDGKEKLLSLNPVPNQRLRMIQGTALWEVRVGENEWMPLADLQAMGAVVVMKYEEDVPSPARRGYFRRMIAMYLMRLQAPGWWGRFVELFGMPIRVAEVSADQQQAGNEMAGGMATQGAAGFFTLPAGAKMQLLEAAKGDAPHERFIEYGSKEITKLIHGATQGTDIQKGAGSMASTAEHVSLMKIIAQGLAVDVSECLIQQLIEGLVARNFGQDVADKHTPDVRVWVIEEEWLDKLADVVVKLKGAGLSTIPTDWIHDRFQIPLPEEDDEVLGEGDSAPNPFGAFQPGQQPPGQPGKVVPFPQQNAQQPDTQKLMREMDGLLAAYTGRLPDNPANAVLSDLEKKAAEEAYNAGREMLKPYVALLDQATKEGWPLTQTLSRVMHLFYGRPGANVAQLRDTLAAVIADAQIRGIAEVRSSRK